MKIHLFDLKEILIKENIQIMDFLSNNFKVRTDVIDVKINKVFLIEEHHLARPDQISFDAYGTTNHIDILLKFNGISNPFSMDMYDMILVPDLEDALRLYNKTTKKIVSITNTKEMFIDPTKASTKDITRINMLQKMANNSPNGDEIKPTNLLRAGESVFETDGTSVTFANYMSIKK